MTTDNQAEREYISSRFNRVFQARPVISRFGLQYRLCEVGQRRLDHNELSGELARRLLTGEIGEPLAGLYTSERDESADLAVRLASARQANEVLNGLNRDQALDELLDTVIERVTSSGRTTSDLGAKPKDRAEVIHPSRYVDINSAREAPTLWVTWNEHAVSPTDRDLWQFLEHCAARQRVPIVLARAVAKATFPILRMLGARGIQYYSLVISSVGAPALEQVQEAAELLGLPHVRDVETMSAHPAMNALLNQLSVACNGRFPSPTVDAALEIARRRGFASKGASARTLRRWAVDVDQECGMRLPRPWHNSLQRWISNEMPAVREGTTARAHSQPPTQKPQTELHRLRVAAEVDPTTYSKMATKQKARDR